MGCMCLECKHTDIVRDNHDVPHPICVCAESENFLKRADYICGECDAGEVETEGDNG